MKLAAGPSAQHERDPGNAGAHRLYDRLGVPRQEKVFYRLAGADLLRLAADD